MKLPKTFRMDKNLDNKINDLLEEKVRACDYYSILDNKKIYHFNDDIDFRPRVFTWDIGFDEYFSPYPIISDQKVTALIFGNRIVR